MNMPRTSSGAFSCEFPEILRRARIMASGFLVSSTEPASATNSRVRERVMRTTTANMRPRNSTKTAIRMKTMIAAPPLPRERNRPKRRAWKNNSDARVKMPAKTAAIIMVRTSLFMMWVSS